MAFAFYNGTVEAATDFEHAVVKIPDSELRACDAIVIRLGLELWNSLISPTFETLNILSSQKTLIETRTDKVEVIIIPNASELADKIKFPLAPTDIFPRTLFSPSKEKIEPFPLDKTGFEQVRSQDLQNILDAARARCVMCSAENYHFSLPSGAHASQFLRLAEAFESLEIVDKFAYWVALGIAQPLELNLNLKTTCLVVDNPSLLILGLRTEAILRKQLNLQCIPSYPSTIETSKATNDLLSELSKNYDDISIVISVASTGRLCSFVENWSKRLNAPRPRIVALYGTQMLSDLTAMCDLNLPGYQHFGADEVCKLCAGGSEAVSIHGSTYMVGYKPATAIGMPPKFFSAQKDFLVRFGRIQGALKVHYNDPNELAQRHHAFYVDVNTLLNNDDFKTELKKKLKTLNPLPDLILSPIHRTASRISKILSVEIDRPAFGINGSLSEGTTELKEILASSKCVLILDDLFITGSRLDRFNRSLREESSLTPNLTSIHFFTVIATPESEETYQSAAKGLVTQHEGCERSLDHLYRFTLPRWHSPSECPWCREKTIIESLLVTESELDEPLGDRLSELTGTDIGLSDNFFSRTTAEIDPPSLGSGSQVLPEGSTALQLVFACASAVQQLRTSSTTPLNPRSFPSPRHMAERVFSKNYSERLLWIALLRSLKSSELEILLKQFLYETAAKIDQEDSKIYLIRELAIAALDGKMSSIDAMLSKFFDDAGLSWDRVTRAGFASPAPPS